MNKKSGFDSHPGQEVSFFMHTASGVHLASYPMGSDETDHFPPYTA
jgi:hypothetical protein